MRQECEIPISVLPWLTPVDKLLRIGHIFFQNVVINQKTSWSKYRLHNQVLNEATHVLLFFFFFLIMHSATNDMRKQYASCTYINLLLKYFITKTKELGLNVQN